MNAVATIPRRVPMGRLITLGLIMFLADVLLWQVMPGISVAVFFIAVAVGIQIFLDRPADWSTWGLFLICLLPVVDLVQFLSLLFALAGIALFCALQVTNTSGGAGPVIKAALRLPVYGIAQNVQDTNVVLKNRNSIHVGGLAAAKDWIVPLALGGTFVLLFAAANPVLEGIIVDLVPENGLVLPEIERLLFWALIAFMAWPLLRLSVFAVRLTAERRERAERKPLILNAASVLRSLIIFNALFAMQTSFDLAYLSGGVSLPEGISYAEYAHRGAYPLLFTALLAGGFAVLAQPFLAGQKVLRLLLLAWVVQTVLLVISSILRLDLYVDVYGLTRLRFAAFIWMGLVACGLSLMVWQIAKGFPVRWLFGWSGLMGATVLFACSLISVDDRIARHNLTGDRARLDTYYLCGLGEGASFAIRTYEIRHGHLLCHASRTGVTTPSDWREWGYRNWRTRRSLATLEGIVQ